MNSMEYQTKFEYEDDEKPKIRVKVKTVLGKERTLLLKPNEGIKFIRTIIQREFYITPEQQCLVCEGVILEDGKTVKDYKMDNGSIINLIVNY